MSTAALALALGFSIVAEGSLAPRGGRGRFERVRRTWNRGSGDGYRRAVAREAASARWREKFYADFDAKRRGAHA